MPVSRRTLLAAIILGAPSAALAQAEGQWHALTGDDGKPVANARLPGELTSEIETLKGVTWIGPREAGVTLYEFFDFNCPWCRAAARDLTALIGESPDLRVGLVHNPILSPQSAQAAKVALAVQRRAGSAAAFALYGRLLGQPGRIDGPRALDAAAALGHDRAAVEADADAAEVGGALRAQMRLAASLGLAATPSYVVGTAGILGHPGRRSLAAVVAAARECGEIVCQG
ncbi:DsbA family protein [uncultured Methylobacterium sp.]|jgi:protein-disulfide isomerase|uniref:DsbA family protein n=1 Tax=uncultured Methylobacterium sp. TaxID=157278 RepID=UPI0026323E13|nr:DsbA family protein [uncultured Methylobacterium sp.]